MEKKFKTIMNYMGKSRNILISLLAGSLFGAAMMILYAPYSGRQTRSRIYQKGIQLRNQIFKNEGLRELV